MSTLVRSIYRCLHSSVGCAHTSQPPPPPPPPPPPGQNRGQKHADATALARNRRWMRNRLDARCMMGRVHRELLERFKRAHLAGSRTSFAVLDEMHNARKLRAPAGTSCRRGVEQEIKSLLMSLTFYTPHDYAGVHLGDVFQVSDLRDIILKEVECKRHILRRGEKPKLKVLGLRYGVSEAAIRKCNGLEGGSLPLNHSISFLYIPPSEFDIERSSLGEGGLIPTRITRSELNEKLRERFRSAD